MNLVDNEEFDVISALLNRPLGPLTLTGKISEFNMDTAQSISNEGSDVVNVVNVNSRHSPLLTYRAVSDSYMEQFESNRQKNGTSDRKRALSLDVQSNTKTRRCRSSSLGHLGAANSQLILRHLVSALNQDFPDYDFSNSHIDQFTEITAQQALSLVSTHLAYLCFTESITLTRIWTAIDEYMHLKSCDIFSLQRDENEESLSDLWCFNLFFVNMHIKKMCYFECSASR